MELIVDRFLTLDRSSGSFAQDLATGQPVWLQIQAAGDAADRRRWLLRCDELFGLRHPVLAPLIDYGFVGPSHRFEAWACVRRWTGDRKIAKGTVIEATRFLHAIALSASEGRQLVFQGRDRAVAVPSIDCGYPLPPGQTLDTGNLMVPGIALLTRPSVGAFCEMLRSFEEQRPRAAAIWGPPGAGLSTALLMLARDARVNGLVPIDAQVADPVHRRAMAGRTLFIIDRRTAGEALSAFLRATVRSPRAHVCVVITREEPAGLDGIEIGRIEAGALIGAVRPRGCASSFIRQAADRSGGLPGVFARALWRRWIGHYRLPRTLSRVAESTATYGSEPAGTECPIDEVSERPMLVPPLAVVEDRSALTRKVDQAERLLAAGRHAPGLRLLRHAIAALARRQASPEAARAGLVLAGELMTRGRTADALRTMDEVGEQAARGGDAALLREVAILAGDAWIDATHLDEAERTLRAALMTARTVADRQRELRLCTTLARCLFWRADFDAAAALLDVECEDLPVETKTRRLLLRARIAAAHGDSAAALAAIGEMARMVESVRQRTLEADLHGGSALVRLLIGDLDSIDAEVDKCLAAARAARRPMRIVSALLVQAEARRRQHRPVGVERRRLLERLVKTATPLLKLRFSLIDTLCRARDQPTALAQFTDSTSVKALNVMSGERSGAAAGVDPLVRELLAILNVCQDAEDERVVLGQVCVRVRKQLRAAAVAFAVPLNGRWETLAADGPRYETDIGERACATGVTIGPHRRGERLESAAPVHYGGMPIAAVCARWTPGADDLARAASVLSMAAAAAAPVVSAALAHRAAQVRSIGSDLIGAAPATAELRRAVEHAAAAPFPVLIEGESGSGKELVARGIHRCSSRRSRAFCTLNCAALPEELVESELFGHARGSFTGAMADRPGVFEEAHGGTLFLDEVGELSPRAQAKLLRVIQEGELRRIGENAPRRIDVRIVAATNRDLRSEADAGRFRRDLLYRLDVIRITVPPLRDRREDLPTLVDHFWTDATQRVGSRATLSTAARAALGTYDWPGNVRELQNVLASVAVRCPKRGVVPPAALPPHVVVTRRPDVWRLEAARRTFEEGFVRAALVRVGGHRSRAADELGLTRQGLNKLMLRLGIE
jgi:DNA-binding NtrC family response regulator